MLKIMKNVMTYIKQGSIWNDCNGDGNNEYNGTDNENGDDDVYRINNNNQDNNEWDDDHDDDRLKVETDASIYILETTAAKPLIIQKHMTAYSAKRSNLQVLWTSLS